MWHSCLDNTKFLNMLYDEIPSLDSVNINNLFIRDSGNHIKLMFDLPKYPEHPPEKWQNSNTASIEIDFFCVKSLLIETESNTYSGQVNISQTHDGLLEVSIKGNLTLRAIAETGYIQRIDGYIKIYPEK